MALTNASAKAAAPGPRAYKLWDPAGSTCTWRRPVPRAGGGSTAATAASIWRLSAALASAVVV